MRYYKNIELSRRFNIGASTVQRWIESALEGKNTLQLQDQKQVTTDRIFKRILSNEHNEKELNRLFEIGRVKKQTSSTKYIKHNTNELIYFTAKQISELINALDDKHIPLKLTYIKTGAKLWDEFVKEGSKTGSYKNAKSSQELLDLFIHHLEMVNPSKKKINFFDIGCGNFMPVRNFINYLNKHKLLNKYVAVDISSELLDLTVKQASTILLPDQIVRIERDFEIENLSDQANLYRDNDTINIISFLGSTIGNYADQGTILTHLRESLIKDDLLLITNKMENEIEKVKFNHILDKNEQFLWIPDLLGIDTGEVQFNSYFDPKKNARIIAMKLDKNYDITFKFENSTAERKIQLQSGDQIILWHHKMSGIENMTFELGQAGLDLKAYFESPENNIGMFVTKKKPYSERI